MFKKLFATALAILLLSGCGAPSSGIAPDISSASSAAADQQEDARLLTAEGIVEKVENGLVYTVEGNSPFAQMAESRSPLLCPIRKRSKGLPAFWAANGSGSPIWRTGKTT